MGLSLGMVEKRDLQGAGAQNAAANPAKARKTNRKKRAGDKPHSSDAVERLERLLMAELDALEDTLLCGAVDDTEKRARVLSAFARAAEKIEELRAARAQRSNTDDEIDRAAVIAELERRLDRLAAQAGPTADDCGTDDDGG